MKRACLAGLASLAIVLPGLGLGGTAAYGQTAFPDATFSGYSSGTAVHTGAVQGAAAGPRIADAHVAFAGASVNSKGLTAVLNEFEQAVVPTAQATKRSYGRGQGLEVGLANAIPNDPNASQLQLAGLAEAAAPPSPALVRVETGPVAGDPLAYASLVRGEALPVYSNNVCVLGQPISYGLGYAADAQLVNAGGQSTDGSMAAPVVAADQGTPTDKSASQSKSFTYLKPNGDGTFGLVTETRQIIAPVTVLKGNATSALTIAVLGEWVLRATATGKPGGAKIDYAPDGLTTPDTPVLEITPAGAAPIRLTFQQVFGNQGFTLPQNPLLNVAIGEDVRAIAPAGQSSDPNSSPVLAADGTEAAGAVDIVRVTLANLGLPVDTPTVADLRIGHMEARAKVPAGGIRCPIPVKKATSADPVTAGENFTWTITIPTDANIMDGLACDLVGIAAVDNASADSGVRFRMLNASNGGVVSSDGRKVTWSNLGNYKPGSPPIKLEITGLVEGESSGGVITNTADVTANLGNCTGGAASQQLSGLAQLINNAGVSGGVRVLGPRANVLAAAAETDVATTPRTGENGLARSLAGFGLVGLALFGRRFIRRITG